LRIAEIGEPMHAQVLVAKRAVEAFDEGALDRFTWANELQSDTPLMRPDVERAPGELRPVIAHYAPG
jgi:hypothetical protein